MGKLSKKRFKLVILTCFILLGCGHETFSPAAPPGNNNPDKSENIPQGNNSLPVREDIVRNPCGELMIEMIQRIRTGSAQSSTSYGFYMSDDGRFIAFDSEANVFVYDRDTETIERVSVNNDGVEGNGYSFFATISRDGRFVSFLSRASNLVSGDDAIQDAFVYDRQLRTIEKVSNERGNPTGRFEVAHARISPDGRFVAYDVSNTTQTYIYVYDRETRTTEQLLSGNGLGGISISEGGQFIGFTSHHDDLVNDDTNRVMDVFVFDRGQDRIERVSINGSGGQGNNTSGVGIWTNISADGRKVVFSSYASNLVFGDIGGTATIDIFVFDRSARRVELVSQIDSNDEVIPVGSAPIPNISSNGNFVVFFSEARETAPRNHWDKKSLFIYDMENHWPSRLNLNGINIPGLLPAVSADGKVVAFSSDYGYLVPGDANGRRDVFVATLKRREGCE